MVSMDGVVDGRSRPRWQVQQVTICRLPKLPRLMLAIMVTIVRATTLRGVSAAQSTDTVPALVWHSEQSTPSEADIMPMVPMKSSTGIPLSTRTFLNTWSDMVWAATGEAANAAADRHTAVHINAVAVIVVKNCVRLFYSRCGGRAMLARQSQCFTELAKLRGAVRSE